MTDKQKLVILCGIYLFVAGVGVTTLIACICGTQSAVIILGGLLATTLAPKVLKKTKVKEEEPVKNAGKAYPCPYCGGKTRNAAKKPGGVEQRRCCGCHRKYELVNGKLRQVAV